MQPIVFLKVDRIEMGGGFWVDIKHRMNFGDREELQAHYVKVALKEIKPTKEGQVAKLEVRAAEEEEVASAKIVLLRINIVGWNFPDEHGKIAPITEANIRQLDPDVADKLVREVNKRNQSPKG